MKISFHIDYRTQWGQQVFVSGSVPQLGKWDPDKALRLDLSSGEQWQKELDIKEVDEGFEYKYFVSHHGIIEWEDGPRRSILVPKDSNKVLFLKDFWRSGESDLNNLYSSPFLNAFFKRKRRTSASRNAQTSNQAIRFRLRAPRIGSDYSFGIVGGIDGSWEDKKPVLMDDTAFPMWEADVAIKSDQLPFEYKYVIYSHKEKRIVTWENRTNRYLPIHDFKENQLTVWTDEDFRYPVGNWKTAGVAIPVFSIRSESGAGCGEFSDIKRMVDWAVKTGLKVIQILPVNDTIATHTWVDSYPYAAISVQALHPMYASMESIGKLEDSKLAAKLDSEAKKLNQLSEVDYEAVMKLKSRFFKFSYDENKTVFLKSKSFRDFFKENKSWLEPYAAFSALRDRFGTPDFTQWDGFAKYDSKKIGKLIDPKGDAYDDIAVHYYIQYHLDRQLNIAAVYARENGVVLKGDIPIGIYRNSVDAWIQPELYNMDCQAGAPPDDFSIAGQNWGFPTYNWEAMAADGFKWWKDRLLKMSEYFDVFRVDHILGFFRIWEIPWEHVEGIMGRFNPALPIHVHELGQWGIYFDHDRFCRPYIRHHMILEIFGSHADRIFADYLDEYAPGKFQLKEFVDTQRKVKLIFDQLNMKNPEQAEFNNWMRQNLYRLLAEVILLESPLSNGEAFNPRIAMHSTYSYRELDDYTRQKLDELYNHFFYHRHNDFWAESAMKKLPSLKAATDMLICGEDLGMVPACVPGVMDQLNILSLAIQRMPNDNRIFWHPADTPYNSVTSTGSHDMSTLREWWQEDPDKTQKFYNKILGHGGEAPYFCEPWIARDVINQHMHSPSMLAIFPLQDLMALDGELRSESPEAERINVPAISQHYWNYRFHLSIERLMKEDGFNGQLRTLVDQGGRRADY